MSKRTYSLLLMLFVSLPSAAQDLESQVWTRLGADISTWNGGGGAYFEVQPRTNISFTQMRELHFQLGLTQKLTSSSRIAAGVFYSTTSAHGEEWRPWIQWEAHGSPWEDLLLQGRIRFENRFYGGKGFNPRLRVMFRAAVPIALSFRVIGWTESFLSLGPDQKSPGLERQRFFFGLGTHLGSSVSVESGYLLQLLPQIGQGGMDRQHVIFSAIHLHLAD